MPPHMQLVSRELQGQEIWHNVKSRLPSCFILCTLMPPVFDGEMLRLTSSSPSHGKATNGTKDFSDSETARGQGNGPDPQACPCRVTSEERGSESSRMSLEATQ